MNFGTFLGLFPIWCDHICQTTVIKLVPGCIILSRNRACKIVLQVFNMSCLSEVLGMSN